MIDIIIVNHNNYDDISVILDELSGNEQCRIWVRDNLSQNKIQELCEKHQVHYSAAIRQEGFALNNNITVEQVTRAMIESQIVDKSSYLLFMNPDAFITKEQFKYLNAKINVNTPDMFTIDLYKDQDFKIRDPSIRHFPNIMTFLLSFLFGKNNSIIDRDKLDEKSTPDWCASSFFGIKSEHFIALNGFNSRFFMYCEDVDLCFRAKNMGLKLTYYPDVRGIHRANHGSKKIFSRNFYWHLSSVIRYMWYRINERK